MTGELTSAERGVLELAGSGLTGGAFWNAARELGFHGVIGYWQALNRLLDTEKALAAYPVTVGRLRRLREKGAAGRLRGRR